MIFTGAFYRSLIFGYVILLTRHVISEAFSRCYSDVNICLWTNGSRLKWSAAETACRQRNNSFLARISDSNIHDKLPVFRNDAQSLLSTHLFWIGIRNVGASSFHWLDGSPLAAGGEVIGQHDTWARFAVIDYDRSGRQFVFYARRWNNYSSSYICQLQQGANCAADDLSVNSKCYRKFQRRLSWFSASNECLSLGGSLALFTDTGRPSQNSNLTDWLNTSGIDKSYWIGLVKSWWNTTDKDGRWVDVQYSNWAKGRPEHISSTRCVMVLRYNQWQGVDCNLPQRYVCQSYVSSRTTTTTTTTTPLSSRRTSAKKPTVPTPASSVTRTSSTSSASGDVSVSPASTTTTTSGVTDNTIAIAVGVGAPCLVIIVIAVLVYCYKVKTNRNAQRHLSDEPRPSEDYATLDLETRGEQPQYDVMPHAEQRPSDTVEYVEIH